MKAVLAVPNSANPAASFSEPGPPYRRKIRYAHATIHCTKLDVVRASQIQNVPHDLRAHSGPGTSVTTPKTTAISAAAQARRSCRGSPVMRNRTLATPHTIPEVRNIQADGM